MNGNSFEQLTLEGFKEHQKTNASAGQVIARLLLTGEVNAITLQALERLTGYDRRTIRRMIQAERRAGACICVNNRDGYYLAETELERASCVASMLHRAQEVFQTARAIAAAEVSERG